MKGTTKARVIFVHYKRRIKNLFSKCFQKLFGCCGLKDPTGHIKVWYLAYLTTMITTCILPSKTKEKMRKKYNDFLKTKTTDVLYSVYEGKTSKHYFKKNVNVLDLFKSFKNKEKLCFAPAYETYLGVNYRGVDVSEYFRTLSCDDDLKESLTFRDIIGCVTDVKDDKVEVNRLEFKGSFPLPQRSTLDINQTINYKNASKSTNSFLSSDEESSDDDMTETDEE